MKETMDMPTCLQHSFNNVSTIIKEVMTKSVGEVRLWSKSTNIQLKEKSEWRRLVIGMKKDAISLAGISNFIESSAVIGVQGLVLVLVFLVEVFLCCVYGPCVLLRHLHCTSFLQFYKPLSCVFLSASVSLSLESFEVGLLCCSSLLPLTSYCSLSEQATVLGFF